MKEKIHTFVVLGYKESKALENCIQSVLNQSLKTNVVIATSTPNDYIKKMAKKYDLKIIINKEQKGIGYDFDFASNCVDFTLVTIAHQDDIYDFDYAKKVVEAYQKNKNALIIFTDYYEIKNEKKVKTNKNLKIKRILLLPLRFQFLSKFKFFKRFVLRFGNAISCPAVTFVKENVPEEKFRCHLKCDVDWYAWEKLSHLKGSFIYIKDKLMGHRIHDESTTTEIIKENIRTQEDLEMFQKFWPKWIAKKINNIYKSSEKNNEEK